MNKWVLKQIKPETSLVAKMTKLKPPRLLRTGYCGHHSYIESPGVRADSMAHDTHIPLVILHAQ